MRTLLLLSTLLLPVSSAKMQVPEPAKALEQHLWLANLVGEWETESEAMGMKGSLTVRRMGEIWIVLEGHMSVESESDSANFESRMTIGYDPEREAFVGNWIDTVQPYQWVYEGQLDEEANLLTLDTEGFSFEEPRTMTKMRDAIRLVNEDHWELSSSIQGEDDAWTQFMQLDYRRKGDS